MQCEKITSRTRVSKSQFTFFYQKREFGVHASFKRKSCRELIRIKTGINKRIIMANVESMLTCTQ